MKRIVGLCAFAALLGAAPAVSARGRPATVAPPANRPPTVQALCDPCRIEAGRTAILSADAQDADGDALTYLWTAPAGTLANPTFRQSRWTATQQPGRATITVSVSDGKGGTAQSTLVIDVVAPPRPDYTFEDVRFDLDQATLGPEARRGLDLAVTALLADPALRLDIEGYACDTGSAEHNLALGMRRAEAVREYFLTRHIDPTRLRTVSYGKDRPKYDNSREATRRLNRRVALVARLPEPPPGSRQREAEYR